MYNVELFMIMLNVELFSGKFLSYPSGLEISIFKRIPRLVVRATPGVLNLSTLYLIEYIRAMECLRVYKYHSATSVRK